MEPIPTEHIASSVEMRWAVRDADEGWHTSLRGPVQEESPQSEHTSQRLGKSWKAPHRWHRCEHDRCCTDPPAKVCDQLRQVACPAAGRVEPENIIDSQCEHNDVNMSLWNLGDESGPCDARGCSNLPNGMPVYRPAGVRGEGAGNLSGEGVRVIRRLKLSSTARSGET